MIVEVKADSILMLFKYFNMDVLGSSKVKEVLTRLMQKYPDLGKISVLSPKASTN
jgi:hypothetical protein